MGRQQYLGALCAALAAVLLAASGPTLAQTPAQDFAGSLRQARTLILDGQAGQAYQLLAPLEAELAGSASFDFLLAVAALDSGRSGEAIATLSRLLALQPRHHDARIELGRAQLESGHRDAARRQFDFLKSQELSPQQRELVDDYLAAMTPEQSGGGVQGWLGLTAGQDSNANAATSSRTFLGLTLNPDNVRTSSPFGELTAGIGYQGPIGPASRLTTTMQIGHRANTDASFVDQTVIAADLGLVLGANATRMQFSLGGHTAWLDSESYLSGFGAELGVLHDLDSGWTVGLRGNRGTVRHDDSGLDFYDVDRSLGIVTVSRARDDGAAVAITAFFGGDDPRRNTSSFGNNRSGARINTRLPLGGMQLQVDLALQEVNYDNTPGFFFGADRRDTHGSVGATLDGLTLPMGAWRLLPSLRYTRNDSTIALYDYERIEFRLSLLYSRR